MRAEVEEIRGGGGKKKSCGVMGMTGEDREERK